MTPIISIESILESQAEVSTHMAVHLESLASHYGQMAGALRENEAGEIFNEEDLQGRSQVHLDVNLCQQFTCRRHESRYKWATLHNGGAWREHLLHWIIAVSQVFPPQCLSCLSAMERTTHSRQESDTTATWHTCGNVRRSWWTWRDHDRNASTSRICYG